MVILGCPGPNIERETLYISQLTHPVPAKLDRTFVEIDFGIIEQD